MTAKLSLLVLFCLIIAGCASSDQRGWSYKHILVSVVDDKSGEPVQGATVIATYMEFSDSKKPTTDENGKVMLKVAARPSDEACNYTVEISNSLYDQHIFVEEGVKDLPTRSEDFIPTKSDVVLKLTSKVSENRKKEELAAQERVADTAAEKLFRESPNFWPDRKNEPYSWPQNEIGIKLIWKRWERASKQELGTKDDMDAIRTTVIRHMKKAKAQVREMRWISPTAVMVKAIWYEGLEATAGYTYALTKTDRGWVVVAFYMDWVS